MSARQAFVPSRPASRAGQHLAEVVAGAGSEVQRPSTTQPHLKPKPESNQPTKQHVTRGQENPPSIQMQDRLKMKDGEAEGPDPNAAGVSPLSGSNRPLNINAFKSNKRHAMGASARRHTDVYVDQGSGRIAAPRPRPSSPLMPKMAAPHVDWAAVLPPEFNSDGDDAHISTSNRDMFAPNGLLPTSTPARRVPLDSIEESMHEDSGYISASGLGDDGAQRTPARTAALLRMGRKRPSMAAEEEGGEETEIVEITHTSKRMRMGADTYSGAPEAGGKSPSFFGGGRREPHAQAQIPTQTQTQTQAQNQAQDQALTGAGALADLFGGLGFEADDAQLSECADVYERARQRWRDASLEEWRAGADEITAKFTKTLQMVMDHVANKATAYSALQNKLAAHRVVLAARGETNRKVREALMRNSGNVLGEIQLGEGTSKVFEGA